MTSFVTSVLPRLYFQTQTRLKHSTLLSKYFHNFRKLQSLSRSYHLVPNGQLTVDNAHKYWLEAFIQENVPEPLSSIQHILVHVLGCRNVG